MSRTLAYVRAPSIRTREATTRGPRPVAYRSASSRGEPGPASQPLVRRRRVRMAAFGIALLIAAHTMDYGTFLVMVVRHGLTMEANPLVAALAEQYGLVLLTAAKVAAVLL